MRSDKKHILVLNRSFWPDIEATGQFITGLCEKLAEKYKVTVIAGRSYYKRDDFFARSKFYNKEKFKEIEIYRTRHTRFWKENLLGRIINWATYSILTFLIALKLKPTVIIACTDPPFLGIVAMMVSRLKSIPFIYNCQDLYPEVALGLGKLKSGIISHAFDYLNKKAFYAAEMVIPIGHGMANRIKAKGVREERIKVIDNWVDTSAIQMISKESNPLLKELGFENKFIIMYSGNIGLCQDFSAILQAASTIKEHSSWCLIFIGDGVSKNNLKKEVQNLGFTNIFFLPHQPEEKLSFSLSMADLHLVPLKKALTGAIVPSKIYGIMAAGRPYLAITDKESEPAYLAKEFGCELWADPDDVETLAEQLKWALANKEILEEMGKKYRKIAERRFDKNIVINEWFKLLDRF